MSTQIAIPIDTARKMRFNKNLKSRGLTSKAFFITCIDDFNNWLLRFGTFPNYDMDSFMTEEERKNCEEALEEYNRGEFYTLEEAKAELWITN